MPHLDIKIKNVNMSLLKGINAQQLNNLYNCFFKYCHTRKIVQKTLILQFFSVFEFFFNEGTKELKIKIVLVHFFLLMEIFLSFKS